MRLRETVKYNICTMVSVSVIKSSRGCDLLVVEKFQFCRQDVLKNGEVRWRCIKKNLKCVAKLYTIGAEYTVTRSELIHNHEPDQTTLERKIVTTSCKRKAEENISEKPSKIIKSVLSKHLPENLSSTDINLIRKNVYNRRRKLLPALPKNINDVHSILDSIGLKTTTVGGYKLGKLIIEGKTKQVYDVSSNADQCVLISKDRITAGDGVKAHDLEGKAAISTKTTSKIFELLNTVGIKTAFIKQITDKALVSKKCQMIPIEWVTRRLATGSFLKRMPGVPEGYRFFPPKYETFFKDDANHDPQWSVEQIISAKFKYNDVLIGPTEVDIMTRTSILVFEVLEKFWATKNCVLVDMKIEFGVDSEGNILVADVIDSDSWRLWPSGDKRLMVDKQVYRNLTTVTNSDLDTVKRNFEWVANQIDFTDQQTNDHLVVILMGSPSDKEHCEKIEKSCKTYGLQTAMRVTSAHKGTEETLKIVRYYESLGLKIVFIAVAGRSNGLGPVVSANSAFPVINCPPVRSDNVDKDVWSSLNVPSGLGCSTVIYPETAAVNAAQILGLNNYIIWSKIRTKQLDNYVSLTTADKKLTLEKI